MKFTLVFQSVADYENQESVWYFYSIYLNKSRQSEMDVKIQQTFDYLNDETGTVAPPEIGRASCRERVCQYV